MASSATPDATPVVKRPFWMHQFAEYLIGVVLVAQGFQSPTPVMPAIGGGLIIASVAIVRGPFSAFGLVSRSLHRTLDLFVIAAVVLAGLQPWISVESTTRATMVVLAGVMAFIWKQSSFIEKPRRGTPSTPVDGRSTEIGRMAGRAAAGGILAARRVKNSRKP